MRPAVAQRRLSDLHAVVKTICTPKEYEAWSLVNNNGYTLRAAADHLGISHTSVRGRLDSAQRKLNAYSRAEFPRRPDAQTEPAAEHPTFRMVIALLIQRDGPNCYLCRTPVTVANARVEHIIPTSRGGTDAAENLALGCDPCNAKKGANYVSLHVTSGRPVYHPPR